MCPPPEDGHAETAGTGQDDGVVMPSGDGLPGRTSSSVSVVVRELVPDEWRLLRALRLAALSDAAEAFGSTYESAASRTEQEWRAWPARGVPFAAFLGEQRARAGVDPVGMVAVTAEAGEPDTAHLIALWVAPAVRGTGVGDALIAAVVDRARRHGHRGVLLEVLAHNAPAVALYRRNGFLQTVEPAAVPGAITMRRAV
jgi:ribosomal protein S18 acetylase RimI-like enzyme